jgi:2Fe-2S ferredoxin
MPKATLISADGTAHVLDVADGVSLMQAATQAGIPDIVGDCGGSMTCATCHILVDPAFLPLLPEVSDSENAILDFTAAGREPNSRLSCQVKMSAALDGFIANIADPQI